MIHTMRPLGKKKKKKKKGGEAVSSLKPLDPQMKEKLKRFPGLSLPDNTEHVQMLLKADKEEEAKEKQRKMEMAVKSDDAKVADEAMNQVSDVDCIT